MSDDDRRTLKKIEKETKLYFFVSILSLVLFWFPIGPTILSILSVIESKKNQKYGLYEKKIKLTKRLRYYRFHPEYCNFFGYSFI